MNILLNSRVLSAAMLMAGTSFFTSCESTVYDVENDLSSSYGDDRDSTYVATTYRRGTYVKNLPRNYRRIDVDGRPYYFYKDTYFQPRQTGYVVVDRPFRRSTVASDHRYGRRLDILPNRYQTIKYGPNTYYYADGVYYRQYGRRYAVIRDPFFRR